MPPKKTTRVEVKAMLSDGTVVPIHELENLDVTEAEEILAHYEFVKVVRCQNCKYNRFDVDANYCKKWDIFELDDEFYCGYGKEKDGTDIQRTR